MIKKIIYVVLLCVVVVSAAFFYDVFLTAPKSGAKPVEVVIAQGDSVRTIGSRLEDADLIAHQTFFRVFVQFSKTQTQLHAGTFLVTPGTSIASIVLLLSDVQTSEVQVTIPEGFTNAQIKARLVEAVPNFDETAWDEQTKDLEGFLFPDTYRFSSTVTVEEIVQKMQGTLDRRLAENGIRLGDCDVYNPSMGFVSPFRCSKADTIIFASILEKEVQTPEDMKRVAGVLLNRMRIGMPLQVDSTLTYVTDKSSAQLTTADLRSASLYNTYTHKGLPPGAICNPGMNAILATLSPTETNDLYFLSAKDGRTIFAETHDEHVANKQKYLR